MCFALIEVGQRPATMERLNSSLLTTWRKAAHSESLKALSKKRRPQAGAHSSAE